MLKKAALRLFNQPATTTSPADDNKSNEPDEPAKHNM
jgi:hypothetical protein